MGTLVSVLDPIIKRHEIGNHPATLNISENPRIDLQLLLLCLVGVCIWAHLHSIKVMVLNFHSIP